MNRKPIVVAAVIVLAGAVAAYAWWHRRPAAEPDVLVAHGNVDIRQVSLAFNAAERIVEMRAKEGDRVKAGDVVALLDTRTTRLRLAQAEAEVGAKEQALKRLKAGSRPEEIAQAKAAVVAAEAELELARSESKRLAAASAATQGRGVSRQDLDTAESKLRVAESRLESARKAAQLVVVGPRAEDIAQAGQELAAARAQRDLVQRELDEAVLRAPLDAVVRARLLEPGDMASPQRPAYTLAITQPKWVRAYVPEPSLSRIRMGMAASVTTDSAPDHPLAGRIGYISSVAEFTPKNVETEELRTSLVYEIRVMVDDPRDALRLGMPATVRIDLTGGKEARASP